MKKIVKFLHQNIFTYTVYQFLVETTKIYEQSILFFNYHRLKSNYKLSMFHNKYLGKRCFIIGNGPSLKKTDLSLLKNEYTFGLNRIYLNYQKMGFKTTFLVSVNRLLIKQCYKDFNSLKGIIKFFPLDIYKMVLKNKNTIFFKTLGSPSFSLDPKSGLWEGSTVTYVAMQLAYFMGFSEVILVGVDHNFVTKGEPHEIVTQTENDPNHFSSKYFKNMKWQLPDLRTSEYAYKLAKVNYEYAGRKIIDATVGGKLRVYKRKSLEKIISSK